MGSEGFRHVETKSNAVLFYSAEENQVNTPAYNARAAFSATGTSTALTARKAYSEESRLQKTKNSWHVKRRGLMLYITCFAPANKPRCQRGRLSTSIRYTKAMSPYNGVRSWNFTLCKLKCYQVCICKHAFHTITTSEY